MMKKLLLILLAACFTSTVADAELLIDDFTLATLNGALDDDIAGTRTITNNGTASTTVDGAGGAVFTGGIAIGSSIDILYTFTTPFNMLAPGGGESTLLVDLFDTVTGIWSLQAFVTNSAAFQANTSPLVIATPGARKFDASLLPVSVATDVKSIQLRLIRQTGGATITSEGGVVAAVPEPASLALLGITGLGGWFVARRRGKKTETVV